MKGSRLAGALATGCLLALPGAGLAQRAPVDLDALLARSGAQLERHFESAQRIVSTETVSVRSFDRAMQLNGLPRRMEYDRRVEWEPAGPDGVPTVTVFRTLTAINGRAPGADDQDGCLAPRIEGEDPLSFLLPVRQPDYEFKLDDVDVVDGRDIAKVAYAPIEMAPAEVEWKDECIRMELDGWYRGEVWLDVASGDVLRHDEHLRRRFEFREPQDRPAASVRWVTLERDDTSTRYERVRFENPDETLMLPRSVEKSWASEGAGIVPRYFRSQRFTNYRRFVTEGRIVVSPD